MYTVYNTMNTSTIFHQYKKYQNFSPSAPSRYRVFFGFKKFNRQNYWLELMVICIVVGVFKASVLWADAFYKSKCPSVRPPVCLSVHF